ncbi:eisosome protein [Rhynchospora pubera]|uniref:Eisosome protein n=1 Tax=Rhynchospora pubera TaxID=906938 RepID=A0AAV8EW87_9POAL|nr:eisosome protein [Rhynchospora pubera]
MGCFLGCFGGERQEERKDRRRRRSAKRLPHNQRLNQRNEGSRLSQPTAIQSRQRSHTQVAPKSSPEKLPLDPAVQSAYCEKTFPLDKSIESFPSERALPLDSAVELVSLEKVLPLNSAVELVPSEKTLPLDPPVHTITQDKPNQDPLALSITQEKPPPHTPVEPSKSQLSEKGGAIEEKNTSRPRKKVTFDLNVKAYEPVGERYYSSDDEIEEEICPKSRLLLSPTCVTFPSNHRYQNCDSDGEIEELEEDGEEDEEDYYFSDDEEEEGLDELDEGVGLDEIGIGIEGNEESYESFFSLSIDKEKELPDKNTNEEVSSLTINNNPASTDILGLHTRDRSQFVHPVLNPVENISQWKEAKVNLSEKATKKDRAMNTNCYKENKGDEVSVDTSLSSWLGSTDNSKVEKGQVGNLSVSREDRPILGALTMEDFKESPVNSSPRRSPSRSPAPDDVPIIGTVGSYWSCNSQGIGSRSTRFKEEKIGKCC